MTVCWNPDDCKGCTADGGRCAAWTTHVDYRLLANSVLTSSGMDVQRILKGFTLVDPAIKYTQPEPRKPTLDEQCDAAMARLTAFINSRCAEHSYAIRANSNYAIDQMHLRHNVWHLQVLARRIRVELVLAGLVPVHFA